MQATMICSASSVVFSNQSTAISCARTASFSSSSLSSGCRSMSAIHLQCDHGGQRLRSDWSGSGWGKRSKLHQASGFSSDPIKVGILRKTEEVHSSAMAMAMAVADRSLNGGVRLVVPKSWSHRHEDRDILATFARSRLTARGWEWTAGGGGNDTWKKTDWRRKDRSVRVGKVDSVASHEADGDGEMVLSSSSSESDMDGFGLKSEQTANVGGGGGGGRREELVSVMEEKKSARRALKGVGVIGFEKSLSSSGYQTLTRKSLGTLQLNIGLYCNQACAHCHVESSPFRTEMMDERTAYRVIELLESSKEITTVDLTGGAPELNRMFRFLVKQSRRLGKEVIDRCNLTVLQEEGQEDLAEFLADHQVRVVASLPCYSAENVSKQRGGGVFERSIAALQKLNSLGYGGQQGGGGGGSSSSSLQLDLVYNPVGASLPPSQEVLQESYKRELFEAYGIRFNHLLAITNMPIKRFADYLLLRGEMESYMNLLVNNFNPSSVDGLMCRDMISVSWDGKLFDCDFNQQLALGVPADVAKTVFELERFDDLIGKRIVTADHCYGCTAGSGSSCTGALI